MNFSSRRLLNAAVPALLTVTTIENARAASATIVVEPVSYPVIRFLPQPFSLYLRGFTGDAGTVLGGLDLDFGGITSQTDRVWFTTGPSAPEGFVSSPEFAVALPMAFDASLLDGNIAGVPDLSFAIGLGSTGTFVAGGPDLLIGHMFLSFSNIGGYTISANQSGTAAYVSDGSTIDLQFSDATFEVAAVLVPEPGWSLLVLTSTMAFAGRARREPRRLKA